MQEEMQVRQTWCVGLQPTAVGDTKFLEEETCRFRFVLHSPSGGTSNRLQHQSLAHLPRDVNLTSLTSFARLKAACQIPLSAVRTLTYNHNRASNRYFDDSAELRGNDWTELIRCSSIYI